MTADFRVTLLGTGTPMPSPDRFGPCALVEAGDRKFLIDAGRGATIRLSQLEIPLGTVQLAIALCRRLGVYSILDPAPAPAKGLRRALYDVDLLTPNQTEAEALIGRARKRRRVIDPKQTASELMARGPRAVVLKRGSRGALWAEQDRFYQSKAFKVKVVDTTAAGDAFTGALAVARAQEMSPSDTLRFANAAGALTCASFGAQPALPTRAAVDELLARS